MTTPSPSSPKLLAVWDASKQAAWRQQHPQDSLSLSFRLGRLALDASLHARTSSCL